MHKICTILKTGSQSGLVKSPKTGQQPENRPKTGVEPEIKKKKKKQFYTRFGF